MQQYAQICTQKIKKKSMQKYPQFENSKNVIGLRYIEHVG